MKRSPKGVFAFKRRDQNEPHRIVLEKFIAGAESWANQILDDAKIKVKPSEAPRFANIRMNRAVNESRDGHVPFADKVHFALEIIAGIGELRSELAFADTSGNVHAIRCSFLMMQFCGASWSGVMVANENPLFSGIRSREGGTKGGSQVEKVTDAHRQEIRRAMASAPRGQKMTTYRALARKLRLSRRTIERVAAEK